MIKHYKLHKICGPSGIFAGYVLLVTGILTVYFTLTAIPLLLLGIFMSFSYRESQIDMETKMYRTDILLGGFLTVGEWHDFRNSDSILVEKITGRYLPFSRKSDKLRPFQPVFRISVKNAERKRPVILAEFPEESEAVKFADELKLLL
jgi:hypothetical protein